MPGDNFNGYCEELLVAYNRRNSKVLTRHLESLCRFLREDGNHVVQTVFGGSVQKGTYVTGLSDVDVLLVVNESSLVNQPPAKVKKLRVGNHNAAAPQKSRESRQAGRNGQILRQDRIQLLPSIRTKTGGVRIAQHGTSRWSKVAHPEKFAKKLAEVNAARDGRVVPVIKLAKAMADCFITQEDRKISGYHMESLAIDAFADYEGSLDPKAMLNRLLRHSTKAVLTPIVDSTGQSRYVDQYLGSANSIQRKRVSTYFGQMRGKVNSCRTKEASNDLFCIGD